PGPSPAGGATAVAVAARPPPAELSPRGGTRPNPWASESCPPGHPCLDFVRRRARVWTQARCRDDFPGRCAHAARRPSGPAPEIPRGEAQARGSEGKTMPFHSFSATPLGHAEPVSLTRYQGKVLLVA